MRCFYRTTKNLRRVVALALTLAAIISTVMICALPMEALAAEDQAPYPIMGPSNVTIGKLMNYYNHYSGKSGYPTYYKEAGSDAPTLDDFCRIYIEECAAENVRVEVAFCQAMKETGFLRFGGSVDIAAYNFAGIGAVDSSPDRFNWFPDVRTGVRAQVQHLKAYASTDPLVNECVDPRFKLVRRGVAPYVEDLGGKWASGSEYGYSIRNDYMANLDTFNGFVTMYGGVDYSAIYDPNYYLAAYPDVRFCYANDGYALITHFVVYGMSEGRRASANFDYESYMNEYADLRASFVHDKKSYYEHYINYGLKEGRHGTGCTTRRGRITRLHMFEFADVYDYDYYVAHNPDVYAAYGDDDIAVLEHFVEYGMKEGRQASEDFNVYAYADNNPDLTQVFYFSLPDYYSHYIRYGHAEGRIAV